MGTNLGWNRSSRLTGLRRFAVAITLLNVLGHTVFGFEQSWAQPLVALATAYSVEILLELVDSAANRRRPYFLGGLRSLVDFLLSAHITALAVAMLTYSNDRLMPVVFATAAAMASKAIFRVRVGSGTRHFLNPSNFGITLTLLLFPSVGVVQPYHFTENLSGAGDWLLPGLIVVTGTLLNARITRRMPLIAAWVSGFALQGALRSLIFGTPLTAALLPLTGVTFVLYTFYMVTDPGTTPSSNVGQVVFGAAVAAAYGLLLVMHVVFGLFFALTIVCAARGVMLYVQSLAAHNVPASIATTAAGQAPAVAGGSRS